MFTVPMSLQPSIPPDALGKKPGPDGEERDRWEPTRWTWVHHAARASAPEARRSLGELCRCYWQPLYATARQAGFSPEDAEDATQTFLSSLFREKVVEVADAAQGRLRCFLLTVFRRFLNHERAKASALKRRPSSSFDRDRAERLFQDYGDSQHHASDSPDRFWDRHWAQAVLRQALDRLAAEWGSDRTKADRFSALRPYIDEDGSPDAGSAPLKTIAERLSLPESTVRVTLHRLRQRSAQLLRETVAETLGTRDPVAIREELTALCAALR